LIRLAPVLVLRCMFFLNEQIFVFGYVHADDVGWFGFMEVDIR